MKHYKNEKERERVIHNCKTILNEDEKDKAIEALANTDKTNFAEFTLRKKLSENKSHKKYYSHFDGNTDIRNNRLMDSASNENLLGSKVFTNSKNNFCNEKNVNANNNLMVETTKENKFESNKEFLENYVSVYFYASMLWFQGF